MWKKEQLIHPVQVGLIENPKSYWATHFYSVLQCLHSHRTLTYSPQGFLHYPNWKFRDLRADLPSNFFFHMQNSMWNWGFQYFLSMFLNYKMSSAIVDTLIYRLSNMYNFRFMVHHTSYKFHLAGSDSILSAGLLNEFTDVFPATHAGSRPDARALAARADLCLVLDFPIPYARMAVFGEVEGGHGEYLSNVKFWNEAVPFTVFSVGVIKGKSKQIYIVDTLIGGVPRVNILLERDHFVVRDFRNVLSYFNTLFNDGPTTNISHGDEEFDFFFNQLKTHWHKDTTELIELLRSHCNSDEIVGFAPEKISIITNLQA